MTPSKSLSFRELLCAATKERNIIPTIGAGIVKPRAAKRTNFTDTSWLPRKNFSKVARINDDGLLQVLRWLDVEELTSSDLAEVAVDFETDAQRADYIVGFVKQRISLSAKHPGLLLDSKGQLIPAG